MSVARPSTRQIGGILLILGALMARSLGDLAKRPFEELLPGFVVVIVMPLSFSITTGILVGFLLHPVMLLFAGRSREVKPTNLVLFLIAVGLLGLDHWGA